MKLTQRLFWFLAAAASSACLASCVSTEVVKESPDGTKVTYRSTAPDAASIAAVSGAAVAVSANK